MLLSWVSIDGNCRALGADDDDNNGDDFRDGKAWKADDEDMNDDQMQVDWILLGFCTLH